METNINIGLHNEFDIVVSDAKTGEAVQFSKAYNVILNTFWPQFIVYDYWADYPYYYMQFGSGTTTPLATDTALTSHVGGKKTSNVSNDWSTFYDDGIVKRKFTIRLEANEYVGASISEVGFAKAASYGLTTKSLLKDANGNPLTIVKTDTMVVDIYGTLYFKAPVSMFTSDTTRIRSYIRWLAIQQKFDNLAGSYQHSGIGLTIGSQPSCSVSTATTFDVPNKKVTWNVENIISSKGNIGGFTSLNINGIVLKLPCTGFEQPVITKEVIATGDGVAKDFTCEFGLIRDNGTAKLYVDDVEVPATFDYEVPILQNDYNLGGFIEILNFKEAVANTLDGNTWGNSSAYSSPLILENPYRLNFPVSGFNGQYLQAWASNDLINWTHLGSITYGTGTISVDPTYRAYRYFKLDYAGTTNVNVNKILCSNYVNGNKVIHAETAPPVGSTVALTYQPNCIAKNANHIINNVKVSISFNEYIPT